MTAPTSFVHTQAARARLRWHILGRGLMAATFWTLFLALWTLLDSVGLGSVGWAALIMYCVIVAPIIILQLLLIADLLAYVVIGKIFAWPTLIAITTEFVKQFPEVAGQRSSRMGMVVLLADCLPMSALAIWSMTVLCKMPESVHVNITVKLHRREIQMERAVYHQATQRLRIA